MHDRGIGVLFPSAATGRTSGPILRITQTSIQLVPGRQAEHICHSSAEVKDTCPLRPVVGRCRLKELFVCLFSLRAALGGVRCMRTDVAC